MTISIDAGQPYSANHLKGLGGAANSTAYLNISNIFQPLVAAPGSGVRRVNQIMLKNTDATDTDTFTLKVVKSGTDYMIIPISLAPGERLMLEFPFQLDANTSLQVKSDDGVDGIAAASYLPFTGGMALVNFTGDEFADALTVATYNVDIFGLLIANTDVDTQTIVFQVIDESSNVMYSDSKELGPSAVWLFGVNLVLSVGWKLEVKHGAAAKTGSILIPFIEVP